jgi:hypothetical protein
MELKSDLKRLVQLTLFEDRRKEVEFSRLTAEILAKADSLRIRFKLKDFEKIKLPVRVHHPRRADQLWEKTCFEAFIGIPGSPIYWEVNVAPTGDWNIYRFDDYRSGQRRVEEIDQLEIKLGVSMNRQDPDHYYSIEFLLSLEELFLERFSEFKEKSSLDLALSAVLENQDSSKSYWAIRHCGERPDFHLRESFIRLTRF